MVGEMQPVADPADPRASLALAVPQASPAPADVLASLIAVVGRAQAQLATVDSFAQAEVGRLQARAAKYQAREAARLLRAIRASDEAVAAALALRGDAMRIEAKFWLLVVQEYDAAQERGEVATASVRTDIVSRDNDVRPSTAADLGLTRLAIHKARRMRDAEARYPGVVDEAIALMLAGGEEPTDAGVERAITAILDHARREPEPEVEPEPEPQREPETAPDPETEPKPAPRPAPAPTAPKPKLTAAERAERERAEEERRRLDCEAIHFAIKDGKRLDREDRQARKDARKSPHQQPNPGADRFNHLCHCIKELARFDRAELADAVRVAGMPGYNLAVLSTLEALETARDRLSTLKEMFNQPSSRGEPE